MPTTKNNISMQNIAVIQNKYYVNTQRPVHHFKTGSLYYYMCTWTLNKNRN